MHPSHDVPQSDYELFQEAAFKAAPERDLTAWLVKRAHRRYGLDSGDHDPDVSAAWTNLGNAGYANDGPVHDPTGVGLMPAKQFPDWMGWDETGRPKPVACLTWRAWGSLLAAAPRVPHPLPETYTYDLIDAGREALAQLSIPLSVNFSWTLQPHTLDAKRVNATGSVYVKLLKDLDSLLATHPSFLLGTWLQSARALGGNATDCTDTQIGDKIRDCRDFMEWNARAQVRCCNPCLKLSACVVTVT